MSEEQSEGRCIKTNRCRQFKTCQHCRNARRKRIGYQLNDRTQDGADYLSMTLTVPEGGGGYRESIKSIMASFKKLRRLEAWKASITGGAVWVEANATGSGDVHLHVMARSSGSSDVNAIGDDWRRLTGAFHVHIRPIQSDDHRRNVAYYADPVAGLNPVDAVRFGTETKGMRLVQLFGDLRDNGPLLPRIRAAKTKPDIAAEDNQIIEPIELGPNDPDYLYIYRLTNEHQSNDLAPIDLGISEGGTSDSGLIGSRSDSEGSAAKRSLTILLRSKRQEVLKRYLP